MCSHVRQIPEFPHLLPIPNVTGVESARSWVNVGRTVQRRFERWRTVTPDSTGSADMFGTLGGGACSWQREADGGSIGFPPETALVGAVSGVGLTRYRATMGMGAGVTVAMEPMGASRSSTHLPSRWSRTTGMTPRGTGGYTVGTMPVVERSGTTPRLVPAPTRHRSLARHVARGAWPIRACRSAVWPSRHQCCSSGGGPCPAPSCRSTVQRRRSACHSSRRRGRGASDAPSMHRLRTSTPTWRKEISLAFSVRGFALLTHDERSSSRRRAAVQRRPRAHAGAPALDVSIRQGRARIAPPPCRRASSVDVASVARVRAFLRSTRL